MEYLEAYKYKSHKYYQNTLMELIAEQFGTKQHCNSLVAMYYLSHASFVITMMFIFFVNVVSFDKYILLLHVIQ